MPRVDRVFRLCVAPAERGATICSPVRGRVCPGCAVFAVNRAGNELTRVFAVSDVMWDQSACPMSSTES